MKHNKKPEDLAAEQWLDDLLRTESTGNEIGADHQSMDAVGLRPAGDILRDASRDLPAGEREAAPPPEAPPSPAAAAAFRDDEFLDTFGEGSDLAQIIDEVNQDIAAAVEKQEEHSPIPQEAAATSQQPLGEERIFSEAAIEERESMAENITQNSSAAKRQPTGQSTGGKKGRPKKTNGYGLLGIPHLLSTAVWLALILVIGVSAGRMIWLCCTDVLAFGREPITATVVIEEDDTIEDVARKLQEVGLIRYTGLFELYADLTGAQEEIHPGTYSFNTFEDTERIVYDYMALKAAMSPSAGRTVVEDLRIPEGYTCAQIFQLLEDKNVCTVKELEDYSINGELNDYWFLEGVERGDKYCLEGYLFPDTYDFYENDDPERVLEKMLNAFSTSFTDQMRDDLNFLNTVLEEKLRDRGYGDDYIQEHRITIREAVIIASMIEKETANNVESFTISSVIYNRLTNAGNFPYLNIDATLVYALGGKAELTEDDKKLNSPYNTYTSKGLPPGPISNPSQNSLAAALEPEETKYYYYAYNPSTEEHKFSKDYEEHLEFLASLETGEVSDE